MEVLERSMQHKKEKKVCNLGKVGHQESLIQMVSISRRKSNCEIQVMGEPDKFNFFCAHTSFL